MAKRKILEYPDPRLKIKSERVTSFGPELKALVQDMADSMVAAEGIGLAAVQIGVLQRLLVLDIGDLSTDDEYLEGDAESERRLAQRRQSSQLEIYINPEILSKDGKICYKEGCLSVPGVYAEVDRYEHLKIKYQDVDGNWREGETHGLRSIALQHEMDHLDGVVFPDRLKPMQRMMLLNKYKKLQAEKAAEEEEEKA